MNALTSASIVPKRVLSGEVADLRGQLFLGGSSNQQQQTVVQILHRGKIRKSLMSQEMTSFLHPGDRARQGSRTHLR